LSDVKFTFSIKQLQKFNLSSEWKSTKMFFKWSSATFIFCKGEFADSLHEGIW